MGKDTGSWPHQQHSPWQSPNLKCGNSMQDPGRQNIFPTYTNPYGCMVSANGSLPGFAVSESPHLKTGQVNGPHDWFYCLPRQRQALTPTLDHVYKDKFSTFPSECDGKATPNAVSGSGQKRFLVFDQSGNQTNLIFSSVIGSSVQHLNYANPNPIDKCVEEPTTKRDLIYQAGTLISDELDENQESHEGSEMQEDTEELNALLYSDDESDYEDEETSTGHSPSEMTGYEKQEVAKGSAEEVASSAGPTKRKRLLDEEYDASSLMDTASSVKPNGSQEYEDDAESSCAEGRTKGGEMGLLLANKRLRIRETVSILQSIIPGGEGKDAVLVLDEAIQYLRSLKLKAKSFGATLK